MEFDIEANVKNDISDMYKITIIERDIKNQEISNQEISFGTFIGTKQIKITTNESTTELKIEFSTKYENTERSLTINSLKLNGKEVPLSYKYIPTKLVQKIRNISIRYKTVQERIEMVNNALELSKDNLLTGIGGNGWNYKYGEVKSYDYTASKIHSYPAKVILEFGIIGILAYGGIVLFLIKKLKNSEMGNISVIFAIMVVIIHSIIDIDMEYTHILVYIFALIASLSTNIESKKKTNIISTIILNIFFVFLMLISIYQLVHIKYYDRYKNISDLLNQRNGLKVTSDVYLKINRKIAQEYEAILSTERYDHLFMYNKIVKYYMISDYESKERILEKYYEKIKQYENKNKNISSYIISKICTVNDIIVTLEKEKNPAYYEIIEKFADLIIEEYDETKIELERCLSKQYKNTGLELIKIENSYATAQDVKNRYLLGVKIYNDSDIKIKEEDLQHVELGVGKDILIYHTHGTESYKSNEKYETYKFYRSTDSNYNVIKIGAYLKQLLEENECNVIHETGYFDLPSTTGAYSRAQEKVKQILADNENISMVIDIHRDAISEEEHLARTLEINGRKVAPLRLVIGIQPENEEWKQNLKLALDIQKIADKHYPGLFQPILLRETGYQEGISKCAILIEVGENCNMLEDALNSMQYFAEIICMLPRNTYE